MALGLIAGHARQIRGPRKRHALHAAMGHGERKESRENQSHRVLEQDAEAEAEKVGDGVLQLARRSAQEGGELAPGRVGVAVAGDLALQPFAQLELAGGLREWGRRVLSAVHVCVRACGRRSGRTLSVVPDEVQSSSMRPEPCGGGTTCPVREARSSLTMAATVGGLHRSCSGRPP